MDKLRIKGEEELAVQGQMLAAVRDILMAHQIQPMVSGGTLLGIMREGDFIPWDWDAELFVRYEEVKSQGGAIVQALKARGMTVSSDFAPDSWKIEASQNDFSIEVRAWRLKDGYWKRKEFQFPAHFAERTRTVILRGERYDAPDDYDGYLTFVYGDWRTPRRTADKQTYLNGSFYAGRRPLLRRILNRVGSWFYRFQR